MPERARPIVVGDGCIQSEVITRWRDGRWSHEIDQLSVEMPVAIIFNGVSHAVMLATPGNLVDFALGFALSEGIVNARDEFYEASVEPSPPGYAVLCSIADRAFQALGERRRNMAGRTGCGLCGVETLDQVFRPLPSRMGSVVASPRISISAMHTALNKLAKLQPMNSETGGMHAAAWSTPDGNLLLVREDVGRHNALDKLIGRMAAQGQVFEDGFLLITSRASVEMVQKAATVGIRTLIAISAPTALAVETARTADMTLVAFARGDNFVAYAHAERITVTNSPIQD